MAPFEQLAILGFDFVFFRQKKQNDKFSHENEAKNWRPKGAPIVRGAKVGANYAEFGNSERALIEEGAKQGAN